MLRLMWKGLILKEVVSPVEKCCFLGTVLKSEKDGLYQ